MSPPLRKQVVRPFITILCIRTLNSNHILLSLCFFAFVFKVIEEQLAFPSGTATAQLISVLHKIPPPASNTLRHRSGYTAIGSEEDGIDVPPPPETPMEAEREEVRVRETVTSEGWSALSWSFAASAVLTVCPMRLEKCD